VEVLARTRHAANAHDRFAELEEHFTTVATFGKPEDVEMVAKQFRDAVDNERQDDPDTTQESRRLDLAEILDGVLVLSGRVGALGGSIIERAIAREVTRARKHDGRTPT
jgi:hypothetical protein